MSNLIILTFLFLFIKFCILCELSAFLTIMTKHLKENNLKMVGLIVVQGNTVYLTGKMWKKKLVKTRNLQSENRKANVGTWFNFSFYLFIINLFYIYIYILCWLCVFLFTYVLEQSVLVQMSVWMLVYVYVLVYEHVVQR